MFYYGNQKFAKETQSISSGHMRDQVRAPSQDNSEELSSAEKRKLNVHNDIVRCINRLNQKGISTPDNFEKVLAEERNVFSASSSKTVGVKTIDAIIRACEIWKPYITPESFHTLVCEQVKSMFRIQACSICYTNSKEELHAYIGHFATLVKEPPLGMSCSVNYYGTVSIYGV